VKFVEPDVKLISRPEIDWEQTIRYLVEVGGTEWSSPKVSGAASPASDAEDLAEFAGKLCYRAWKPGLNPNVTKVRSDQAAYIRNILDSGHGSVLEHANFSFVFSNVSRVFTHELVRHRAGSAFSQESMRFVRLDDIPFWMPDWAQEDPVLAEECFQVLYILECHQIWMAKHFGLDEPGVNFSEKKAKTSFMRRFAPEGVGTSIVWTANIRSIRNVIEQRTAPHAEEEIRLVFDKVANLMLEECPLFFQDFQRSESGEWVPENRKV
jgi:thymidylate synthase (FAD)